MRRRAVFLDRDGVMNRTTVCHGTPCPPASVGEVELLPGVESCLEKLCDVGLLPIVVTNQPDVARGAQRMEIVEQIHASLMQRLPLQGIMVCYHDDLDNCSCRKPEPGLLLEAAARWSIDLKRSYMIGDRWKDVEAGRRAGCTTFLIERTYSEKERCVADYCVESLVQATDIVVDCMARASQEGAQGQ
jgi:D-glycero-D-manno-heptose 1,7-bisphosphate phosphatase